MFHQIIPNSKYLQISGDELSANIKLPSRAARASQAIEETLLGFICNICYIYLLYLLHRCRQQGSPTAKWELQISLFGLFSILVKTGKQRNMQTFGQQITVSEVYKRSKFWKNHLKRSSLYLIRGWFTFLGEIRFVSKRTGIRRWKLANCKMGGSCPLMPCCAQIWTQTSIVASSRVKTFFFFDVQIFANCMHTQIQILMKHWAPI